MRVCNHGVCDLLQSFMSRESYQRSDSRYGKINGRLIRKYTSENRAYIKFQWIVQVKAVIWYLFVGSPMFSIKNPRTFSCNSLSHGLALKPFDCKEDKRNGREEKERKTWRKLVHADPMRYVPAGGYSSRLPSPEDMTSSVASPAAINGK